MKRPAKSDGKGRATEGEKPAKSCATAQAKEEVRRARLESLATDQTQKAAMDEDEGSPTALPCPVGAPGPPPSEECDMDSVKNSSKHDAFGHSLIQVLKMCMGKDFRAVWKALQDASKDDTGRSTSSHHTEHGNGHDGDKGNGGRGKGVDDSEYDKGHDGGTGNGNLGKEPPWKDTWDEHLGRSDENGGAGHTRHADEGKGDDGDNGKSGLNHNGKGNGRSTHLSVKRLLTDSHDQALGHDQCDGNGQDGGNGHRGDGCGHGQDGGKGQDGGYGKGKGFSKEDVQAGQHFSVAQPAHPLC